MYLLRFNSLRKAALLSARISLTGLTVYHFNPMSIPSPTRLPDWIRCMHCSLWEPKVRVPVHFLTASLICSRRWPYHWSSVLSLSSQVSGHRVDRWCKLTFTDYLDDVSTTYVNPEILINENGMVSYLFIQQNLGGLLKTANHLHWETRPPGRGRLQ